MFICRCIVSLVVGSSVLCVRLPVLFDVHCVYLCVLRVALTFVSYLLFGALCLLVVE